MIGAGSGVAVGRTATARRFAASLAVAVLTPGCTAGGGDPAPAPDQPTASVVAPGTRSSAPEIPEPTATNTLPPPPAATAPAPTTAGRLTADALPMPRGWRTVVREGGPEEGYEGNGTWVHGRDPRYAAHDVMAVGCAPVNRDDYDDPQAALEGTYEDRRGRPGIGLVLEFESPDAARRYFSQYLTQVRACTGSGAPLRIEIDPTPNGLVDRRTYPDGEWTEVAQVAQRRVTLVILSDPGHRLSATATRELLAQLG